MLTKTRNLMLAGALFACAVLLFTRIDYLVNSDLYRYGLKFNDGWFGTYSLLYRLLYQLMIVFVYLLTRRWRLVVVLEAFVLSSGQDLVYFIVWGQGNFPTGDWTWMPWYKWFGHWTTEMQIGWTVVAVAASLILTKLLHRPLGSRKAVQ